MTMCLFDIFQHCLGGAQQVDMHSHESLIDNMQPAFGQKRMHVRYPPVG
jgi:hypothetical protein